MSPKVNITFPNLVSNVSMELNIHAVHTYIMGLHVSIKLFTAVNMLCATQTNMGKTSVPIFSFVLITLKENVEYM